MKKEGKREEVISIKRRGKNNMYKGDVDAKKMK